MKRAEEKAYPFWRLRIEQPTASTREGDGVRVIAALEDALRTAAPATALALEYVTGCRTGADGMVYRGLGLSRELVELSAWLEQSASGFTLAIVDGRGTEHSLAFQSLEDALRILSAAIESAAIPAGYPYEVTK
jgi:hypothetical protein